MYVSKLVVASLGVKKYQPLVIMTELAVYSCLRGSGRDESHQSIYFVCFVVLLSSANDSGASTPFFIKRFDFGFISYLSDSQSQRMK